ncbi:MAG: hypothetical protein EBW74_09005 [Betaproteobacteria bacterium]|nr:hypothetical protein [Betaproteobacteria bacterium]
MINDCFGGFGLTDAAFEKLLDRKGVKWEKQTSRWGSEDYYDAGHLGDDEHYLSPYDYTNDARSDPDLIAVKNQALLGGGEGRRLRPWTVRCA